MITSFNHFIRESGHGAGETRMDWTEIQGQRVPLFTNEFWTSRQRQASSLHEISYRACFKPQLPRFFIQALTQPGDLVYDPFSGRGTTVLEAGLLGRNSTANDINPLSALLSRPRFFVPGPDQVEDRLNSLDLEGEDRADIDLSMFYHRRTEAELVTLRRYLLEQEREERADHVDHWIRMVATNRLTGHSPGFFSVYTLPPNQAVSPQRQIQINEKRSQVPEYRDIKSRIIRKTHNLVRGLSRDELVDLRRGGEHATFLSNDARHTPEIADESVQLTVTSPPFLDVVQYARDNWLRCWFNGIDAQAVAAGITVTTSLAEWEGVMAEVFTELYRITVPGGWVAFEVGEVRKGKIRLDEHVLPLGVQAGFRCAGILVNRQEFTKTANIWGVRNNTSGTNTNRIVILHKE